MATKMEVAIQQDYATYKKELSALEQESIEIDNKIEELEKEYAPVLDFLNAKARKKAKAPKRAKRGETSERILETLRGSKKPLRANELIEAMGGNVSGSFVRQLLPKMVEGGFLTKDQNKAYTRKGERKVVVRKAATKVKE